jgi:hypothetical protein
VWAHSYERSLNDVLALQAEVARAIAREVQIKLTAHEQTRLDLDDTRSGRWAYYATRIGRLAGSGKGNGRLPANSRHIEVYIVGLIADIPQKYKPRHRFQLTLFADSDVSAPVK